MAQGLSGNTVVSIGNDPVVQLTLIEMRVLSNLLQAQSGNQAVDELNVLRNDQAFELGIPTPLPGTNM